MPGNLLQIAAPTFRRKLIPNTEAMLTQFGSEYAASRFTSFVRVESYRIF
jgi:hypothetical protein